MRHRLWLTAVTALLLGFLAAGCAQPTPQVITLAGSGRGYADGNGTAAQFNGPVSVAADAAGNVYVADSVNHRIRAISTNGEVTTLAGSDQVGYADGPAAEALFSAPTGVALDQAGKVYVADSVELDPHPMRVRVIAAGIVSTLAGGREAGYADGPGGKAFFRTPANLAVDKDGNVYVADTNNHRIRLVRPDGTVSTLAGSPQRGHVAGYADGPAAEAKFNGPRGVAVDARGNVYVADTANHCIRMISGGQVTTLAGSCQPGYADGQGAQARFNYPTDIAVDAAGNLYVADTANHAIRKITPAGLVSTVAGNGEPGNADGPPAQARFRAPEGIAVDGQGNLYVADTGNHRIRKILRP